jgi:hypothetical protein
MEIVIAALLNTVAYQHKTQAAPVVPEPEFSPFDHSHLRHFPKDTEDERATEAFLTILSAGV